MNQNKRDELLGRLKFAEGEIATVRAELKEAEAHVPWEPYGVDSHTPCYAVTPAKVNWHTNAAQCSTVAKAGVLFHTREAAEKASKFFTFYQRLYQLALECNAKHTDTGIGSLFYVYLNHRTFETTSSAGNAASLFTSYAAAQEACDIMNRDQWIMPTM